MTKSPKTQFRLFPKTQFEKPKTQKYEIFRTFEFLNSLKTPKIVKIMQFFDHFKGIFGAILQNYGKKVLKI